MKLTLPKFHDRTSLYMGGVVGFTLVGFTIVDMFIAFRIVQILPALVGLVLGLHCFDMTRYYKKHRIIKIEKTDTHRIITVGKDGRGLYFKLVCFENALRLAWSQGAFRAWVAICTIGIAIGIYSGLGMTDLVLLVAIACLGLGMEVANTSIETLLDIVHPSFSEKVKIVKDSFSAVPIFVYSAYVVSWLILVVPSLWGKIIE